MASPSHDHARWARPRRWLAALRPVLLTSLAALAFGLLLRWHHGRFRGEMVGAFRRQQSQAVAGFAGSLETAFARSVRGLEVLAVQVASAEDADAATEAVKRYSRSESGVLTRVFLLDAEGRALLQCPGADDGKTVRAASTQPSPRGALEARYAIEDRGRRIRATLPVPGAAVELGRGRPVRVGFTMDLRRLVVRCLARSSESPAGKSRLYWLISPDGEVLGAGGAGGRRPEAPARDALRRSSGRPEQAEDESKDGPARAELSPRDLGEVFRRGVREGRSGHLQTGDRDDLIAAYCPLILGDRRMGLVVGARRAEIAVPINAHERITYALIGALALLYFATGYVSYRSEYARRQLERQRRLSAEAASRAKSDFLARVSHEVRTPMNGIIGMTDLVLRTPLTDHQRRCLELSRRSAGCLMGLINDLLDLSKIEAGKFELLCVPFNIRDVLDDAVEPFRPRAAEKRLELQLRIHPNTPARLCGDPGRLRQVVTNLLDNALRFTDSGWVCLSAEGLAAPSRPSTRLRGARDDENRVEECPSDSPRRASKALPGDAVRLRISVQDTGTGIDADQQRRIFDAFEQARDARGRGGTGLGLAICSQLVELMGGTLELESTPGKGTTFRFDAVLSVAGDGSAGRRPATSRTDEPFGRQTPEPRPVRVLLAEDNEVNREHATMLLEEWGHEVTCAPSGRRALAEWEAAEFDAVLMDVQMPDVDGLEATRRIRAREDQSGGHIPIIAMTANAMPASRDECLDAGMDAHITKPIDPSELHRVLADCTDALRGGPGRPERAQGESKDEGESEDAGAAPPKTPFGGAKADFDAEAALGKVGGNRGSLVRLIRAFLSERSGCVRALHAAVDARDADALRGRAHKLKGSLGLFGATRLATLAEGLEEIADWSTAERDAEKLLEGLERLCERLEDFTAEEATCES